MHPNIYSGTIYSIQDMEATQVAIDRWMEKEVVVDIDDGILLSHKKWNNAICSKMNGPRDYHSEWSKSDREK